MLSWTEGERSHETGAAAGRAFHDCSDRLRMEPLNKRPRTKASLGGAGLTASRSGHGSSEVSREQG